MTSLTKKALFDSCTPDVTEHQVEGWGTVYLKTLTELQRSTRIASMFDDKGEVKPESRIRQRVNLLIDHLCDKSGKPLFNEGDAKDLLKLDAVKLDALIEKLSVILEDSEEGNE